MRHLFPTGFRPRSLRSVTLFVGVLLTWLTPPAGAHGQALPARVPVPGAPAGVTAFVDVNIVPMDRERMLPQQTVLVQRGWITALGPSGKVAVPAGATRIDSRGKFLIPGLTDCHGHLGTELGLSPDSTVKDRLFLWLSRGATTVRNMDYMATGEFKLDGPSLLRLRRQAAAGELWGPRIYTSGQWAPRQYTNAYWGVLNIVWVNGFVQRPPGEPAPRLDSIPAYVAAYKAAGYDYLKIHEERSAVFDTVLTAARREGIRVVGHVPDDALIEHAVRERMQSIDHLTGFYQYVYRKLGLQVHGFGSSEPPLDMRVVDSILGALARTIKDAGTWNCPTLAGLPGSKNERMIKGRAFKAMYDAGVGLLLGTDDIGVDPTATLSRELNVYVKAGLTPYQALLAGTRNSAVYFGTLHESGTVTVGKRADLVLLNGDPLQDVNHTAHPAGVMIGGRWLSRAAIDRRLAAIRAAAPGP